MVNIVRWRWWFILFSIAVILPGMFYLVLYGLRLGIDFTGGTLWQIRFDRPVAVSEVRDVLAQEGYTEAFVRTFSSEGENPDPNATRGVSMRLPSIEQSSQEKARLEETLRSRFGNFTELAFNSVGPAVGAEIAQRSIIAVALVSLGILAYMAFAFRKVRHPWRYGTCAVIAMLHDVAVVVGIFAILGHHAGVEVDALFVTALLTVIGFSVHDTIVVFDRIRENQSRRPGEDFESIVNHSLLQTLVRSLNTSITTMLALLALYLFGGVTIRTFVLALLIGMFSGTYSSIFNASMLLVLWENREFWPWHGKRVQTTAAA